MRDGIGRLRDGIGRLGGVVMALNPKIFVISNVYVNNRLKMEGRPMIRRIHWIREIRRRRRLEVRYGPN